MDVRSTLSVHFRVRPAGHSSDVAVDLRLVGERWVAVVEHDAGRELGIGRDARAAVSAALAPLGSRVVAAVLADPALLEPSCAIAEFAASRRGA
jgi:hypothetical protein